MRTREKIMVLLVAITAILGSILYIYFRNNEVDANYLRWLFANNLKHGAASPAQWIAAELPPGRLLYAGLAIFAVVVLIVVLKMLRDGELQALRLRLMDIGAAKNQAESLLQEEVWKGKTQRQAKDTVTRDLEASIDRIEHLITDLDEKEKLVEIRENELVGLRSCAVEQSEGGWFDGPSDRTLRAELDKTKADLQDKDRLIAGLEGRLSAKTKLWESQLREQEALVKARDGELAGLRTDFQGLSEGFGAERLLQDELREKKKVLEAHELASRNEEQRLSEKVRALEHQLGDKDKLLRSSESEILTLRRQLRELGAAKEDLESRLQEELGNAENDRRAIEALVMEAEQKYAGTIQSMQVELGEKDLLLRARDDETRGFKIEVRAAHARLSEMTAAKERAELALQQELREEQQRRRENETARKDVEDRFAKDLESLHGRVSEKEQTLKSRDGEIKMLTAQITSLNEQVHKADIARDRVAASLQEQVHKEQETRQAGESAIRRLEDNFRIKISALEKQLTEKDKPASSPDTAKLNSLRAELKAVNQRMSDLAAAKDKSETMFREALREKTEGLQSKEFARKDLEENFADQLRHFEIQLREKADVIQNRDLELLTTKKQLAELSASKAQAIRSLQATVQQQAELLQAKETRQVVESRFSETIRSLEAQLNEKDEMLARRDIELGAVGTKVSKLTAQLAGFDRAKDQDARLLREELRQKTQLLHVKESAIKKIEDRFTGQIRALESQLGEKAALLETRDSLIDTLMAKISALTQERAEFASDRDKSDRLVQEELREKNALLQAKDSSIGEVEGHVTAKVQSFEHQLVEKQKFLEGSGGELSELRNQIYLLTERIGEAEGARFRAEAQLQDERNRASEARLQSETSPPAMRRELNAEANVLDDLLKERDELLKARDKLIQELMVELKDKKSQLAKHEIEVGQARERRDVWKHRLSKLGIRLKN